MATRGRARARRDGSTRDRSTGEDGAGRGVPAPSEASVSIALPREARAESIGRLTQLLADTMALRDLYKKHHWQASGPMFYALHLLYDKHYAEQVELMDDLAERIQALGGESVAFPHDVAETTSLPRPPRAAEPAFQQLQRLASAHELILGEAREAARAVEGQRDDGTLDLIASEVIPRNEAQAWFIRQQLASTPTSTVEAHPAAPTESPRSEAWRSH